MTTFSEKYKDFINSKNKKDVRQLLNDCAYEGYIYLYQFICDNYTPDDIIPDIDWLLRFCSIHGHLCMVQHLVQKGVVLKDTDEDGKNQLLWASMYGQIDIIRYLVEEHGFSNCFEQALQYSAKYGSLECVQYLVKHGAGADINAPHVCVMEFNALQGCCYKNHIEICRYLIDHCRPNLLLPNNMDAIRICCSKKHTNILMLLIEYAFRENMYHPTILGMCSMRGCLEAVQYIVGKNMDIHVNEEEPLICACIDGHLHVVQYLVEHGADIHARNERPLTVSAQYNRIDIVKFLLKCGANVNACDDLALRLSIDYADNLDMVKVLVEHGANIHAKGILKRCGFNINILKYLVEQGARIFTENGDELLFKSIKSERKNVIEYLISLGLKIPPYYSTEYLRRLGIKI